VVVDALSRRPTSISLMSIASDWKAQLLVEYSKDRFTCEVLDGAITDDRYRLMNEIIYCKDWIYLVPNSQLREKIMQAVHDSPLAGHREFTKTYRAIREHLAWKGLKGDVLRHVQVCGTCYVGSL